MAHILVIGINYSPEPTGSASHMCELAEMPVESEHIAESYVVLLGSPH